MFTNEQKQMFWRSNKKMLTLYSASEIDTELIISI